MKLLDSNIVLYAVGRPHRYKDSCAQLLREAVEGGRDYAINTELLQEVLLVYTSRGERALGLVTFDYVLTLFPQPIPIAREEMVVARGLLERYEGLSSRDAVHAAVVQTQMLEGIVTTDRAFRGIPGLAVFDPLDLASGR